MTWPEVIDWREWGNRSRGFIVLILVGVIALVLLVGWFGLLEDRFRVYRAGKAQEQSLSQALMDHAQALSLHEPARQALDDAMQQLRDARWRLAAGVNMTDLLDELTSSGHAHGLVFEQFDVEHARVETGYQVVPLRVQVLGRYGALRLWLEEWFGQVRLLRATNLRLVGLPERPGLLRLQVQVASYHPGEDLAPPASLAHEPARPAALAPGVDLFAAWSANAAVTGLAGVPLGQLEMVGSLSQGGRHQALLWSAGHLYRVSPGDRLGRNEGVVVRIDRHQLEVRERVFVAGVWHERSAYLAMRKRVNNEVMDDAEQSEDQPADGNAIEPGRDSDALSGRAAVPELPGHRSARGIAGAGRSCRHQPGGQRHGARQPYLAPRGRTLGPGLGSGVAQQRAGPARGGQRACGRAGSGTGGAVSRSAVWAGAGCAIATHAA
ncbi:pilus assembly protein PilP [Pseudomonas guariconensis]|nr:pilus assembly protein PilP [Pseudomonas guariconensis]